eukprot:TRINITY_DN505_c0_g1_i3.p1 TRINITY_DN505_c0_g1~~TRINITY_DN505_c0_g1_i3.p1  ORF type:complete len:343 (-),score=68.66 TRINITY_DN505_c0_g1_i3:123-1151(-)
MTTHAEYKQDTNGSLVAQAFSDHIKGKTVLITGVGPDGIGRATSLNIASHNPSLLIIAGRSKDKLTNVENEIKQLYPAVNVRSLLVDLSSIASVRNAANEVNRYHEPTIDILINNAGVMDIPTRTVSEEGIEMHFATNYVGHFLFTNLILPKLKSAALKNPKGATRIINVSSSGHNLSPVRFSDWNFEGKPLAADEKGNWAQLTAIFGHKETDGYNGWVAYGQSKAANVLFTEYLNRNLEKYGIVSLSIHPGFIQSPLMRHIPPEENEKMEVIRKVYVFEKTPDQGSSTTLVAAFDPKLDGKSGIYLDNCQLAPAEAYATDPEKANNLWKLGEHIVQQHFEL